jgi:NAD(P)-dependent dehydrogenase (short-subunit alcohol dehydrogenase family)
MKDFAGKVAVITGAGSGFGREFARIAAGLDMKLALADIQADALEAVAAELRGAGAEVLALRTDVSKAEDMDALAAKTYETYGAAHLLFNNAGVGAGGFVWENSVADWEWVLGVNVWSVIHGIRLFVPRMIAQGDECHVVNTASVAGLLSAQTMAVYNVSKHAVVTLSETLYQDLRVAKTNIGVTVLCPAFVSTGIAASERNRPADLQSDKPLTESQKIAAAATIKAVESGKLTAAEVAAKTFDCVRENKFYCLTHPKILGSVELRLQDILAQRNPSDPFSYKPSAAPQV